MVVPGLILVCYAAILFYWRVSIQRVLHRAFDQKYFQTIVTVNRLEFPVMRKAFEGSNSPVEYPRVRMIVKRDFLALTYLLKNAANLDLRHSLEERLMIFHFHLVFVYLIARHCLRLREEPAVLKLTAILQCFTNIVSERMNSVRLGNLSASDYQQKSL